MTRSFITRKKFYDIRREFKRYDNTWFFQRNRIYEKFDISPTTLTRILKARNFKEYKASGNVYGKGVKSLRKRYLFILEVIAVVLLILNLR